MKKVVRIIITIVNVLIIFSTAVLANPVIPGKKPMEILLYQEEEKTNYLPYIILIGGGVIVISTLAFIIIKKRKNKYKK